MSKETLRNNYINDFLYDLNTREKQYLFNKLKDEMIKQNIDEIIRLALHKYKLSNRKSMNTFIFTQSKKYQLDDTQIQYILDEVEIKIKETFLKKENEWQNVNFTCNVV